MRPILLAPLLMALALAGCADDGADESSGGGNETADGAGELNGQLTVVNESSRETAPTNPTPTGEGSTLP